MGGIEVEVSVRGMTGWCEWGERGAEEGGWLGFFARHAAVQKSSFNAGNVPYANSIAINASNVLVGWHDKCATCYYSIWHQYSMPSLFARPILRRLTSTCIGWLDATCACRCGWRLSSYTWHFEGTMAYLTLPHWFVQFFFKMLR
jgi:hypothetical protein